MNTFWFLAKPFCAFFTFFPVQQRLFSSISVLLKAVVRFFGDLELSTSGSSIVTHSKGHIFVVDVGDRVTTIDFRWTCSIIMAVVLVTRSALPRVLLVVSNFIFIKIKRFKRPSASLSLWTVTIRNMSFFWRRLTRSCVFHASTCGYYRRTLSIFFDWNTCRRTCEAPGILCANFNSSSPSLFLSLLTLSYADVSTSSVK